MAKRIRGTIAQSGPISILFNGATTILNVVRQANGTYDMPLPTALDTAMAAGGAATVSYLTTNLNISVPTAPGYTGGGTGGGTGGTGVGAVGEAPPIYSGTATLSSIPDGVGSAGIRHSHYGNGQVEFQWRAPATFNTLLDIYEVVLDGIIIFRNNNANSFLINGVSLGNTHTVSARVVRDDGEFGPLFSHNFTI